MSETLPSFTERHMPTYSRWFSRPFFQAIWRNLTRTYKHVLAETDLPAPVKETIRVTVKKTRLWHREMRDVAAELVTHFQDGLDAGKTSDELVKSFGDTQQAAKLIRNAKRRCRPLWWQACWYASRAFGLFVCYYLIVGLWQYMGRPEVKTNYLALLNKEAESWPETEKAWPLYREAIAEIRFFDAPDWYMNGDSGLPYSQMTTRKDWPEIEKWLLSKQHAVSLVRQASRRNGLGFLVLMGRKAYSYEDRKALSSLWTSKEWEVKRADPSNCNVPASNEDHALLQLNAAHLTELRQLVYILQYDVILAVKQKDGARALADVEAMLGISRHMEEGAFLVSELIALSIQSLAIDSIHSILDEAPETWSNEQLQQLAHAIVANQLDPYKALVGERRFVDDVLQRIYTDDGNGDGRVTKEGITFARNALSLRLLIAKNLEEKQPQAKTLEDQILGSEAMRPLILPTINAISASRKEMKERYEQMITASKQFIEQPYWQDSVSESTEDFAFNFNRSQGMKYWLIDLLFPATSAMKMTVQKRAGYREGTLIGIALELYHREHKKWPKTLAELSPAYLPKLPVDRVNGTPLLYKIVNDRPLVYSRAEDGDDDGGTLHYYMTAQYGPDETLIDKKEYVEWTDYHVGPPALKRPDPKFVDDGDWIIWTTLPDHRKKLSVEEPVE